MKTLILLIAATVAATAQIGANYGARDPQTCQSRKDPARGAPSAALATKYFQCDTEREVTGAVARGSRLYLVSDAKLEVAPNARPFNRITDSMSDIDPAQPVYNIRGSFSQYQCLRPEAGGAGSYPFGRNCTRWDNPAATGICYKNTFAEWHCVMDDRNSRKVDSGLPPPRQ